MKKKLKKLFVIIMIIMIFSSWTAVYAQNISEQKERSLYPMEKLTDADYRKFCENDEEYYVHNLYSGEDLVYNKETPIEKIKDIYTDGIEELKKQESEIITPLSPEYKNLISEFGLSSASNIPQGSIKKQNQPYSAICLLRVRNRTESGQIKTYLSSGFIIGPSQIATAAHCLKPEANETLYDIDIYTAIRTQRGDFILRKYNAHLYEYVIDFTTENDYGFLTVVAELTLQGYFKLNNASNLLNRNVSIIGYRSEDVSYWYEYYETFEGAYTASDPYICQSKINSLTTKTIRASADTSDGMSGSPWIVVNGAYLEIVAIHSAHINNYAVGTRITTAVYNYYDSKVNFNSLDSRYYIKNLSIDKDAYFTGGVIKINVWEAPSETSWVAVNYSDTVDYPNNATGMWCYLETNSMTYPSTFKKTRDINVTLTANIRDVTNMSLYPLTSGYYKIVLFLLFSILIIK